MQNIRNNFQARTEDDRYHGTFEQFFGELKQAGQAYASAHAALTVYNEAQWNARQAAVEVGLMNFPQVEIHLAALEKHLGDPQTWVAYAGLVMIDDRQQPIPFRN